MLKSRLLAISMIAITLTLIICFWAGYLYGNPFEIALEINKIPGDFVLSDTTIRYYGTSYSGPYFQFIEAIDLRSHRIVKQNGLDIKNERGFSGDLHWFALETEADTIEIYDMQNYNVFNDCRMTISLWRNMKYSELSYFFAPDDQTLILSAKDRVEAWNVVSKQQVPLQADNLYQLFGFRDLTPGQLEKIMGPPQPFSDASVQAIMAFYKDLEQKNNRIDIRGDLLVQHQGADLELWRLAGEDITLIRRIRTDKFISDFKISPDRNWIAVCGTSGIISIYQVSSGQLRWRLNLSDRFGDLEWSPKGKYLGACGVKRIMVWERVD